MDWYQEMYHHNAMTGLDPEWGLRTQRARDTRVRAETKFKQFMKELEREFEPGGRYYLPSQESKPCSDSQKSS